MAQHGYLHEYDEQTPAGEDRERYWTERRDRDRGSREAQYGREREFMFGGPDEERFGRGRTDHPDAHYLDWRDRHMRELDRDYDEYRREREQQFHRDFSAWRRRRHGNPPPLQPGMTQSGLRQDTDGTLELTSESPTAGLNEPDPTDTATLGTTSGGRRRS